MAGHSHSSNIKFRKDRVDQKRAKAFAKLSRMITVAARQGGGSLDGNAKLRLVVDKARVLSMPKDGIDRAIKKGIGAGDLGDYEEIVYEGYGPEGVAVIVVSSDLEEVLGVSNRILVMAAGRQAGILDHADANDVSVMELATA